MAFTGTSILVATDLSPRCDRAVDRAMMLAQEWQTRLKVLHVPDAAPKGKASAEPGEDAVRATLPDPQADVDILLRTGSLPKVLAETAVEADSGLIVTGVARFNNLRDFILGTAVDYIIRHAQAPVLVVKQRPHAHYRTVLVATDLSETSRAALLRAAALFPHARLHLVHAAQMPYEKWLDSDQAPVELQADARHRLDRFLAHPEISPDLRHRVQLQIGYGEIGAVINMALEETRADLLVLGTVGAGGLRHATLGSTAASLLAWVPVDALMVRG